MPCIEQPISFSRVIMIMSLLPRVLSCIYIGRLGAIIVHSLAPLY